MPLMGKPAEPCTLALETLVGHRHQLPPLLSESLPLQCLPKGCFSRLLHCVPRRQDLQG